MVRKVSHKKSAGHFYGNKKRKTSIKFFYNFLIFIIAFLCIFLVISIYFSAMDYINRSQVLTEKKDMQFMFVDNQGIEHNISQEENEHGAANKRDYLFSDYNTGELIDTGGLNKIVTGSILSGIIVNKDLSGKTETKTSNKIILPIDISKSGYDVPKKSCTTPRGKILESGKSVLAYQQRTDVPDICNIQRRICNDGVLGGSFLQKDCKTGLPYEYTKEAVISYNEKKIDPLIQPDPNGPINKGANFDNKGKLNTNNVGDTVWGWNDGNELASPEQTIGQIENIYPNCIAPWGSIVLNGQFVKAYRYKNGFINHPCEVQLRPCMQGDLEGNYKNASCKNRDISFEDFMYGYFDAEQPSMQRMIETLNKEIPEDEVVIKKGSLWNMLSNLWQ